MLHKTSALGEQHPIHNWVVADNAAKTALTLTTDDVGKVAYQIDTATFYVLRAVGPVVWVALGDATAQQTAWEAYADGVGAAAEGYADGIVAALSSVYQSLDTQLTSLAALSYSGNAKKVLRVNAAENNLEFAKDTEITIVTTVTANAITPTASTDLVRPPALSAGLTINNPTGTPEDGWGMVIELVDNGTSRSLTWGSAFSSKVQSLPAATTISKTLRIGVEYHTADAKWYCMARAEQA